MVEVIQVAERDGDVLLAAIDPGEKITVTVMRDGREQDLSVTLGNLNDFDQQQQASADQDEPTPNVTPGSLETLGLTLEQNPDGDGVRVASVAEDSPAADRGLEVGDIIVAVGSRTVNSVSDVEEGVAAAQDRGRDAVLFRVQREDGTRFVGVPFDRG